MELKYSTWLYSRHSHRRQLSCSFPNSGCPSADSSIDCDRPRNETVRQFSGAETEVYNPKVRGPQVPSLHTDLTNERRGTAPICAHQKQRLKSRNVGGGAGSSRSTILRKRIRCCTGNLQGNPSFTALSAWTTASHSECDAPFLQWNSLGFKTGISDCDAGIECLSAVQPGYKIRPKLPRPRFCILPALSGSASTLQIR